MCEAVKQASAIALFSYSILELTFARLRYSLGGDRPSQTTNHAYSSHVIRELVSVYEGMVFHWRWLNPTVHKEVVGKAHSHLLLHNSQTLLTLQSCSKGAQGLSV